MRAWVSSRKRTSLLRVIAVATTIGLIVAGFGGISEAASNSASALNESVSGAPYKLMLAETGNTNEAQYLPAIEKGVNARGGIAGHPLEIVDCQDHNEASNATTCAQQAASDPRMLGIISNEWTCGSEALPILAKADMASIGDQFFCPENFTSPQVFTFAAGAFSYVESAAIGVKTLHLHKVNVVSLDTASGHEFVPLVQGIVSPAGGKIGAQVYIPLTATDMSSYAADLVGSPGLLLEGATVDIGVRLGKALQQQAFKGDIIYTSTTFYPSAIKQYFGNPTNAYIEETFNLNSPGYRLYQSDLKKYAHGSTYGGTDLVNAWLAANVVANLAKKLPKVSAASIFHALSTSTALNTFGMTAPLNFTVPSAALGGEIPRAANTKAALYKYKNGSLVEVSPFEDLLPAK